MSSAGLVVLHCTPPPLQSLFPSFLVPSYQSGGLPTQLVPFPLFSIYFLASQLRATRASPPPPLASGWLAFMTFKHKHLTNRQQKRPADRNLAKFAGIFLCDFTLAGHYSILWRISPLAPSLQLMVPCPTYLYAASSCGSTTYVDRPSTETLHLYLKGSVQYLIIQGPGDGWQRQTWIQVRNIKQDSITLQ